MKGRPEGGYTSGQKKHYRRDVWSFIDRSWKTAFVHPYVAVLDREVLILDTSDGYEFEELLRRGYDSRRIHVVNRNPAELAVLQRRYRDDPRMRGPFVPHGKDAREAVYDLLERGTTRFHGINFDFCAPVSRGLIGTVSLAGGLLAPWASMVVTVMRGREKSGLTFRGSGIAERDEDRGRWLKAAMCIDPYTALRRWDVVNSRTGQYKGANSRVSMLWAGVQVGFGYEPGEWEESAKEMPACL